MFVCYCFFFYAALQLLYCQPWKKILADPSAVDKRDKSKNKIIFIVFFKELGRYGEALRVNYWVQ